MKPYPLEMVERLSFVTESRILLVVLDGIGDLPVDGRTPLEAATTPHLDEIARQSELGLSTAVLPGITPGSGPGHLALFGYDPMVYDVGRGVLSALGIGLDLGPDQVAARGNFATAAEDGAISDRRAGRIPTKFNETLIEALRNGIPEIDGVEVSLYTEAEYRFVLVLKGDGLSGHLNESDPGRVGEVPVALRALDGSPAGAHTAGILDEFARRAGEILRDIPEARNNEPAVNTVLLRGIGKKPDLPQLGEMTGMSLGSVAAYPMYRGVSRLVGMECLPIDLSGTGERTENKIAAYREHAADHDFIYFHVKKTDSSAEDGDFPAKVGHIEAFDAIVPDLLEWKPDVILITGDHSTPCSLKAHSWHPLPVMLWSRNGRPDGRRYTESDCRGGSLGTLRHLDLLPLMMASALKLRKYGA